MDQPLTGIRVIDLGQIYQGPYCGLMLSYLGADVIKVERPGGENVRDRSVDGETPEVQLLNATKRGVALDLKTEAGKQVLRDLVANADVVLENFKVGTMDRLGVGYEELTKVNEELIYAHGSGYGDDGPYTRYPAMDLTVQSISGVVDSTGFPDGPPVKAGIAVADFMGGIHLATGIVSALFQRERTGEGQYVEVGMFDSLYPTLTSPLASWAANPDAPPRTGNRHSGLAIAPYNVYEVEDGYVAVVVITDKQWERFVELADRPDLVGDARFETKVDRAERIDTVDDIVEEWLVGKTKDDVVETLIDAGIPAAPVQTIEEIVEDPHLLHRDMVNYLPNKGAGKPELPVPGMPIKLHGSDPPAVTPSPRIGEHTDEVLADVAGYSDDEIEAARDAGGI